jgi:hypothetical protein
MERDGKNIVNLKDWQIDTKDELLAGKPMEKPRNSSTSRGSQGNHSSFDAMNV